MVYAIGADLCAKVVLRRERAAMLTLVCEMLCERVLTVPEYCVLPHELRFPRRVSRPHARVPRDHA